VQPEDLQHPTLAPPTRKPIPLWRRPSVVALVAAAAAVAVAVPIVSQDHHTTDQPLTFDHRWPPSPRHPQPSQKLSERLSGDVDGDGSSDQIRVSRHTLTVTLAAEPGRPLTAKVYRARGLVGLADLGTAGNAVLVAVHDLKTGDEWWAFTLRDGRLKYVQFKDGLEAGSISVVPGYRTSWITADGVAMTGKLDPVQNGERHLAVLASRAEVRNGSPVITPVGRWCWDVVTQQVPAPCAPGVDNAYDPGPRGSLPALLPLFSATEHGASETDGWREGSTFLRTEEGPVHEDSPFKQQYVVQGTIDGHDVSAPAGLSFPNLVQTFVDLGHGVRGIAITDDGLGVWHLLSFVDGRLVPLAAPEGDFTLHPGVISVADGKVFDVAQTWISPDKQVFTRLQTGGAGQFQLYQWQVTDGSGTKLEPLDRGQVCIDDYWGTYGTCTSQPN